MKVLYASVVHDTLQKDYTRKIYIYNYDMIEHTHHKIIHKGYTVHTKILYIFFRSNAETKLKLHEMYP